jgi:ATP phosphoribosyltransferase regulatory subunit
MIEKLRKLLQIPQGTESFHLEEAFKHKLFVRSLEELFTRWGYLPAQVPVFDFFDTYRPLLKGRNLDTIYRLMDREGELLMLRSDITLFLAKQMGLLLTDEELPARVWYADTILRHQDSEDISRNEFFQTGIELIGKRGMDADLEVLLLLDRVLSGLVVSGAAVHVGSRGFWNSVCGDFQEDERNDLVEAVRFRDWETLHGGLLSRNMAAVKADLVTELFGFIGTSDDFTGFLESFDLELLSPEESRELRYLGDLFFELDSHAEPGRFRIDLSEIGSQPYHTGIVFQGYAPKIDSSFVTGGRYDDLLGFFGFDTPSVGFSLMLRKIEPFLEEISAEGRNTTVTAPGASFSERFSAAEKLRKEGRTAIL